MLNKKIKVLWGGMLVILLIGLGIFYNHHRNSQPLKPVIIYKYTEPPEKPLKSVKTESKSKQTTASDSESELEPVETLPSVATEIPQNDAAFEVPPELEVDVAELAELTPEEVVPFDFKTTPSGYSLTPYWDRPMELQEQLSYEHKLIDHVLVKLWNQGVRDFVGGSIGENGRVHPHYVNTLYVKWKEIRYPDGTLGPVISKSFGGGDVRFEQKDIFDLPPPNVRLIDLDSSEGQGINPYAFLTSQELP